MTTTPQLEKLHSYCQRLRLYQLAAELPARLEPAAKKDLGYADFLDDLLTREVQSKQQKHLTMRVSMARFPFHKTLREISIATSGENCVTADNVITAPLGQGRNALPLTGGDLAVSGRLSRTHFSLRRPHDGVDGAAALGRSRSVETMPRGKRTRSRGVSHAASAPVGSHTSRPFRGRRYDRYRLLFWLAASGPHP
jgi:hypothetical protein